METNEYENDNKTNGKTISPDEEEDCVGDKPQTIFIVETSNE